MRLVIDRSKWLRGEGSHASYMLRPTDMKRCCLGFLGEACGYTPEQLAMKSTPNHVVMWTETNSFPKLIASDEANSTSYMTLPTNLTAALMRTNDDTDLSEQEREDQLITLFKEADIDVEFVDSVAA